MADTLMRSFRFRVKLRKSPAAESGSAAPSDSPTGTQLGDGGFQECSGLEVEMEIQEHREGGRNDGVIRQVGRAKYSFQPLLVQPIREREPLLRIGGYDRLKALLALDGDPDEGAAYVNEVMAEDDAKDPYLESYQHYGKQA